MQVLCIDHINIVVSDLEKSVRFYTELLGFRIIKNAHLEGEWIETIVGLSQVSADVVYIVAPGGEPRIELLRYTRPTGESVSACSIANTVGLRHIALRVKGMDEIIAKLHSAGVKFAGKKVTVPGSVVKHDAGEKALIYFYDPDGVILELAEYN